MRLADTLAAELAQAPWFGVDAPGAEPTLFALRRALREGLPGDVELEDLVEWAQPALASIQCAPNLVSLEGRIVGALAAAMILGARLQETNGS